MRTYKNVYLPCLVSAALLIFCSTGAFAGLIDSFGPDVPNFTETVTLDKYTGVAPLTGAKITLFLQIDDGQYEFDNDGSTSASVAIDLSVSTVLSSNDVTLPAVSTVTATYGNTFTLAANDGDSTRGLNAGGADYSSLNTGIVSVSSVFNVSPANLAGYVGPGTFNVMVNVTELLNILADGGVAISSIPVLAGGTVSIEYIPEPATLAILAFGGLMLRKRGNCKA